MLLLYSFTNCFRCFHVGLPFAFDYKVTVAHKARKNIVRLTAIVLLLFLVLRCFERFQEMEFKKKRK